MYDFLIVGAGLTGATLSHQLTGAGYSCLVVDKRSHIGGNCYTENRDGIIVHLYGPHYFHTNNDRVWKWITQFGDWRTFPARVKICIEDKLYSFPVNLMTLYQLWGVKTPADAKEILKSKRLLVKGNNAKDFLLRTIGRELYELFFEGYTTKQWGRDPEELPVSIVNRIPVRFTFNDNYHLTKYAVLPVGGYTPIVEEMLKGARVELNTDFLKTSKTAKQIIYTGPLDALYDYKFGYLEYRSLHFEHERLEVEDFQGNCQINYPSLHVPYTRILEWKHFHETPNKNYTWVCREYPLAEGDPYYPINTASNDTLFRKYQAQASADGLIVAGRLGLYKYMNMDEAIAEALFLADKLIGRDRDIFIGR